uniref:Uncharacterized protein n=1 Tax=Calcidiscus leptoporus TaxID=127549 RepID=A0A7S0JKQ7_9EUKA
MNFPRMAAQHSCTLAELVGSSFGPRPREKLLVSPTNSVLLTCSGASILAALVTSSRDELSAHGRPALLHACRARGLLVRTSTKGEAAC